MVEYRYFRDINILEIIEMFGQPHRIVCVRERERERERERDREKIEEEKKRLAPARAQSQQHVMEVG